jgi:hypothetical protein
LNNRYLNINNMARIKNINGTSQTNCKCGSWLQHWINFSGQNATYCKEITCTKTDLVGAHVQKADSTDQNWYIVPLCKDHNKSTGELEIRDGIKLVSANKKETCEK